MPVTSSTATYDASCHLICLLCKAVCVFVCLSILFFPLDLSLACTVFVTRVEYTMENNKCTYLASFELANKGNGERERPSWALMKQKNVKSLYFFSSPEQRFIFAFSWWLLYARRTKHGWLLTLNFRFIQMRVTFLTLRLASSYQMQMTALLP